MEYLLTIDNAPTHICAYLCGYNRERDHKHDYKQICSLLSTQEKMLLLWLVACKRRMSFEDTVRLKVVKTY